MFDIPKSNSLLLVGAKELTDLAIDKILKEKQIAQSDIYRLKEARIEELRYLLSRVQLKPYQSDQSCLVLTSVQNWRLELSNSLLKILEEPPNHLVVILTTNDESALLDTILSRVAKLYVGQGSMDSERLFDISSDLTNQFSAIKDLLDDYPPATILESVLLGSTPAQQSFILNQLSRIGNAPINKKLILEASCLELLILGGRKRH